MTTDTAAVFPGLKVDFAAHRLNRFPLRVNSLKIERLFGRCGKIGGTILFNWNGTD